MGYYPDAQKGCQGVEVGADTRGRATETRAAHGAGGAQDGAAWRGVRPTPGYESYHSKTDKSVGSEILSSSMRLGTANVVSISCANR